MIHLKLPNVEGFKYSVVVLPLLESSHSRSDVVMRRRKLFPKEKRQQYLELLQQLPAGSACIFDIVHKQNFI